jgi:hypothetical protein
VPGAEEHVFERRIHVTQTPVREEPIVQHTEQYGGLGTSSHAAIRADCARGVDVIPGSQSTA